MSAKSNFVSLICTFLSNHPTYIVKSLYIYIYTLYLSKVELSVRRLDINIPFVANLDLLN